jgi:PRTRC genetic system ThiF family protein
VQTGILLNFHVKVLARLGDMMHKIAPKLVGRKVHVVLVGAGGTGSHVLTGLVDLHLSMLALGHPEGLDVTVYDDDMVSEANVGRQKFAPSDVGLPKAMVLVNRANMLFGTNWKAKVSRIDKGSRISADIVIGCVDNRLARASIAQVFRGAYWLDFGNRRDDGQVVLGQIAWDSKDRSADRLPHVGELFPDSINPDLEEQDDSPSCSLAEALEKQSLFINKSVADYGLNILSMLFRQGEIAFHGGFINLKSGRSTPLAVDVEVWKRLGHKVRKTTKPKQK